MKRGVKYPNPNCRPVYLDVPFIEQKPARIKRNGSFYKTDVDQSPYRQNTAQLYNHLYAALVGGTVNVDGRNGDHFYPDVTRMTKQGPVQTEVKAISRRNGKPLISHVQAEKYARALLQEAEKHELPQTEYAFFRYGKGHETMKLVSYNEKDQAGVLAQRTTDLLVLPLPLIFAFLANEKIQSLDHNNSWQNGECDYWRLHGKTLTLLHNTPERAFDLIRSQEDRGLATHLDIDTLGITKTIMDRTIYCEGVQVMPFSLTRFELTNYEDWLEAFKANHQAILTKGVGIRDRYQEDEETRKANERTKRANRKARALNLKQELEEAGVRF